MRIWPDHGGALDLRCDDCPWTEDVTFVEPPYDLDVIAAIAQAHNREVHP